MTEPTPVPPSTPAVPDRDDLRAEARKNTIASAVFVFVPLLGVLLLSMAQTGALHLPLAVAAGLVVITVGLCLTGPVYSIRALRQTRKAGESSSLQITLLILSICLALLPVVAVFGAVVLSGAAYLIGS